MKPSPAFLTIISVILAAFALGFAVKPLDTIAAIGIIVFSIYWAVRKC